MPARDHEASESENRSGSALRSIPLPSAEQIVVRADRVTLDRIESLLQGTGATWRRQADRAAASGGLHGLDPALLIGREPTPLDEPAERRARAALTGKRVLITGAGGSIGSEMARKVAALDPAELILMERSENALFEIDREIRDRFPRVKRRAMLHDVVDYDATMAWLLDIRPQTVFHAAAHKHVPIMEDHPAHAVNNNVFGTLAIADAARAAHAERFVMISTDKAVNPRSVMGATKRMAEVYVRSLNHAGKRSRRRKTDVGNDAPTRFTTVRFGNVLGSAGSVIPVWEKQLAEGGPVTVTHPEMTRFFMTIPEAAMLVIQAGSLSFDEANGAEVFVLDMGSPLRIVELAERLVRLHGYEPILAAHGRDIVDRGGPGAMPIVFTGVRPGEKLHEELAHASEELRPTPAAGVQAWAAPPGESDAKAARAMIALLEDIRHETDHERVLAVVRRLCPTVGEPEQSPSQKSEDSRSAA